MYETNPGLEDVVATSMSSLSFSGVTLVFVLTVAAVMWCVVPFVLIAIRRRMNDLERSVDENSSIVANDLRRITDMLIIDRMLRNDGEATQPAAGNIKQNPQPAAAPAPVQRAAPAPSLEANPDFVQQMRTESPSVVEVKFIAPRPADGPSLVRKTNAA